MDTKRCRDCRWFYPGDVVIKWAGGCHRHAPYREKGYGRGVWPIIEDSWFCGDYEFKGDE